MRRSSDKLVPTVALTGRPRSVGVQSNQLVVLDSEGATQQRATPADIVRRCNVQHGSLIISNQEEYEG